MSPRNTLIKDPEKDNLMSKSPKQTRTTLYTSVNPFAEFREECRNHLQQSISQLYPKLAIPDLSLEIPPTSNFGELASSICFDLARELKLAPLKLAEAIIQTMDRSKFRLIEAVKSAGAGYINFYVDHVKLAQLAVEAARKQTSYGYVRVSKPLRIIVEHTSANPIHPLHIGTARNPLLGDALARILTMRGHKISRHFYIDDMGRQVAIIAYGYEKLGAPKPKPNVKPDHFVGQIYAITSCITEIKNLKRQIEKLRKEAEPQEQVNRLQTELDDWVAAAADLERQDAALFNKLLKEIDRDPDPEARITELIKNYEHVEKNAKKLLRGVSELCLKGFRETLSQVSITFDSWDWESDILWGGNVSPILNQLQKTPYVFETAGVLELNAEQVVTALNLKQILGIKEDYVTPSLTLTRSDGTTLYTTRDMAYSLWKFKHADKIINVIGVEQSLAQLQLKIALCALGQTELAKNQIHFAIGLVELPGYKMSARRGRYITFDQVIAEAIRRAFEEVSKRSPHLTERTRRKIAEFIGIGAIKYALVSVEPDKNVTFTWERVLDFERNSAPFINYAYTRACGILRKKGTLPKKADYRLLNHPLEKKLILQVAKFPEVFVEAAENLNPDDLANYANNLAEELHSYYEKASVIRAESKKLGNARAALIDAVRVVLNNSMSLLGIRLTERM